MSIAVFDVGGTFIKYAEMHENIIVLQGKVPTPMDSQESFLIQIEDVLSTMSSHIEGIVFSLPGVIDVDQRYVYSGGSLRYNDHCYIEKWEERFQLPVELENDARCAAIAELSQGNMQGIDKGVVLTFGTGIGGGIIIDGKVYKGSHLISGEVSIMMTKDMRQYGTHAAWGAQCGSVHLVEKIASAKNMVNATGEKVFELIMNQDRQSIEIFEEYCYEVALQLHNLQCILDPKRICIGGGMSANPLFIEGIIKARDALYDRFPIDFPRAEIYKCCFENDANLRGAYQHYIEKRG